MKKTMGTDLKNRLSAVKPPENFKSLSRMEKAVTFIKAYDGKAPMSEITSFLVGRGYETIEILEAFNTASNGELLKTALGTTD